MEMFGRSSELKNKTEYN